MGLSDLHNLQDVLTWTAFDGLLEKSSQTLSPLCLCCSAAIPPDSETDNRRTSVLKLLEDLLTGRKMEVCGKLVPMRERLKEGRILGSTKNIVIRRACLWVSFLKRFVATSSSGPVGLILSHLIWSSRDVCRPPNLTWQCNLQKRCIIEIENKRDSLFRR